MGERMTKEREAEIREYYAGEAQPSYYVPPEPGDYALADVRDLLAEIDALREEANGLEAQLATLREAAEAVDEADASGDDTVLGVAIRRLRGALSTPGHTLAEIRRAAQVEVLRDAVDTACDAVLAAVPCCNGTAAVHAVRRSLEKRADDLEAGR